MEKFNDPPVFLNRRSARKSWDLNPDRILKMDRKWLFLTFGNAAILRKTSKSFQNHYFFKKKLDF